MSMLLVKTQAKVKNEDNEIKKVNTLSILDSSKSNISQKEYIKNHIHPLNSKDRIWKPLKIIDYTVIR